MKIAGKIIEIETKNGKMKTLEVYGEDKEFIVQSFDLIERIYGEAPDDPYVMMEYYKIIKKKNITHFRCAIDWIIKNHTEYVRKFPLPAVFYKALEETHDDEYYKDPPREPPKEEGEQWTEEQRKKFWDDCKKKINGSNKMPNE